ncbi:MAG: hypothetical protein AB7L41_09170 [Flavobacteriaceae bacterium]
MGRLARLGLLYGVLGFAAGFVFGTLREFLLIPLLGDDLGRQVEFPLVTAAVALIGAWMTRNLCAGQSRAWLLFFGLIGTAVLVAIESVFALAIVGQPLKAHLASYDPATGSLLPYGLLVMALVPQFTRSMQQLD